MKKSQALFFFILPLFAAATNQTDSLFNNWNNKNNADSIRLKNNELLSKKLIFSVPDSSFRLQEEAFVLAKGNNMYYDMAKIRGLQGVSYSIRGDYGQAIEYYEKASKINSALASSRDSSLVMKGKSGLAANYTNMGIAFVETGQYAKAIEHYLKASELQKELNEKENIAKIYTNIGNVYFKQGFYSRALEYFFKALDQESGLKGSPGMAVDYENIGTVYNDMGKYEKALEYYSKSYEKYGEQNNKRSLAKLCRNIGVLHNRTGNTDSAKTYYLKAFDLFEEVGDKLGYAGLLINMGNLKTQNGNYQQAMEKYREALAIYRQSNSKKDIVLTLGNIGVLYKNKKAFGKAEHYLEKAIALSDSINTLDYSRQFLLELSKVYSAQNKYAASLEAYKRHTVLKDSVFNIQKERDITHHELQYEFEKQHMADSIAHAKETEIKDAQLAQKNAEIKAKRNQQFALFGGLGLTLLFSLFLYNRFKVTRKQRDLIRTQKEETDYQKKLLEEKNREITDSIAYAKRIQSAILPPRRIVKDYLSDSFILYMPKDLVAGDFYWMERLDEAILFAVADCTGHGVPGALVSVVCNNALNRAVREFGLKEPGKILDKTREIVIEEFEKSEEEVKDGMDITLCCLKGRELHYAGANNPLWLLRNGTDEQTFEPSLIENSRTKVNILKENCLLEVKADKQPIGNHEKATSFTTHRLQLQKGDSIFLFSDGFADQFGGPKGKKYKTGKMKRFLGSLHKEPCQRQRELLEKEFNKWKGQNEQVDDVCIMGLSIT